MDERTSCSLTIHVPGSPWSSASLRPETLKGGYKQIFIHTAKTDDAFLLYKSNNKMT